MKNAIISFVFAAGLLFASCSTSKDVRITERDKDDGTVVKRERRVDDNGVVIKKSKRDKNILTNDNDDKDVKIKVKKDRKNRDRDRDLDDPAIVIEKDK